MDFDLARDFIDDINLDFIDDIIFDLQISGFNLHLEGLIFVVVAVVLFFIFAFMFFRGGELFQGDLSKHIAIWVIIIFAILLIGGLAYFIVFKGNLMIL